MDGPRNMRTDKLLFIGKNIYRAVILPRAVREVFLEPQSGCALKAARTLSSRKGKRRKNTAGSRISVGRSTEVRSAAAP